MGRRESLSPAPGTTVMAGPDDHRVAWLALLAAGLQVLEAALPSPVPGIKPGLANIVTLLALWEFGWRCAAWVSLLRVGAAALWLGTLLSPGFFLSAGGALAALAALGLGRRLPAPGLGPLGLSVLAAAAHTGAQFAVARYWLIPHPGLDVLAAPLLTAAVLFGALNGIIAGQVLARRAAPSPCTPPHTP